MKKIVLFLVSAIIATVMAKGPSGTYKAKAGDKNCPPVLSSVAFKKDGSWSGQYGIGGKWKMEKGKLMFQNTGVNIWNAGKMSGKTVMMPAPADAKKLCTLMQ